MGRCSRRSLVQAKVEAFPPFFVSHPNPPSSPPNVSGSESDSWVNLSDKVSPSVLLIIIILAIVFFVSGLLHLLVRFLWRPQTRDPDDYLDDVTALQGQLQQLFHLHDSGVDQSFIDALPVFHYKSIIGLKINPFDCAVCLCEFEPDHNLRLLPKCSHAFHMECIDTWLLSHSTCPLCRSSLLPDFSPTNNTTTSFSPFVFVLESGSDTSREIVPETENNEEADVNNLDQTVVNVKLGKYRNVDGGDGSSNVDININNIADDSRRCFSMGSFAYVMDENSSLQVPIRDTMKKKASKKRDLPLTPGHRYAKSECDCESARDFKFGGLEASRRSGEGSGIARKESFSISKIWLRGKKGKENARGVEVEDASRRAVSFRFAAAKSAKSEMDVGKWENDEENQSCYSVDSQGRAPSFARRTLIWLTGRQNKVVHSSSASNI